MEFFTQLFVVLLVICIGTEVVSRKGAGNKHVQEQPGFKSFQRTYLVVYLINMAADWMQGPYVYALYESYGFQKGEIAILFIGGFFSSMMFGTFVGGMADKYGRKVMGVVFGVLYSLSCITKLWNSFYVLLLGRLLGGIATSLLFSVFEAWMVFEHHKRGYSIEALSQTFSYATFGNGCVAIVSSLAASVVADSMGYVAPFMLSLILLIIGTIIVTMFWNENYGDTTVDIYSTFLNATEVLKNDTKITVLGLTQSLFEASMYTFVFMWTPALQQENNEPLPFGLIFACYMVSIMIGSSLFNICISKFNMVHETLAQYIFGLAALSLFLPTVTGDRAFSAICFCLFEITCGMYWPCLGTIRGKYIPETSRAAIMNFFRVPLNLLVVIVLVKISSFDNDTVFLICTAWLGIAVAGQNWFACHIAANQHKKLNNDPSSSSYDGDVDVDVESSH